MGPLLPEKIRKQNSLSACTTLSDRLTCYSVCVYPLVVLDNSYEKTKPLSRTGDYIIGSSMSRVATFGPMWLYCSVLQNLCLPCILNQWGRVLSMSMTKISPRGWCYMSQIRLKLGYHYSFCWFPPWHTVGCVPRLEGQKTKHRHPSPVQIFSILPMLWEWYGSHDSSGVSSF